MKWKIVLCVALALILQTVLGKLWISAAHTVKAYPTFVDLPLIVVVYFALRRDAVQSLFIATAAGLAVDALGGGLLGVGGLSFTVTAFVINGLVTRFALETPLMRIPVLAGATALQSALYFALTQKLFGDPVNAPFPETLAYKVIATTIIGTFLFFLLDMIFSDRALQRRQFAFRRRFARRRTVGR